MKPILLILALCVTVQAQTNLKLGVTNSFYLGQQTNGPSTFIVARQTLRKMALTTVKGEPTLELSWVQVWQYPEGPRSNSWFTTLIVTNLADINLAASGVFTAGNVRVNEITEWFDVSYLKRQVTTNWISTATNSAVQLGFAVTNLSVEIIFRGATNLVQLAQDYGQVVGLRTNSLDLWRTVTNVTTTTNNGRVIWWYQTTNSQMPNYYRIENRPL